MLLVAAGADLPAHYVRVLVVHESGFRRLPAAQEDGSETVILTDASGVPSPPSRHNIDSSVRVIRT